MPQLHAIQGVTTHLCPDGQAARLAEQHHVAMTRLEDAQQIVHGHLRAEYRDLAKGQCADHHLQTVTAFHVHLDSNGDTK